jgi:hypothetical protein
MPKNTVHFRLRVKLLSICKFVKSENHTSLTGRNEITFTRVVEPCKPCVLHYGVH